MSDDLVERLSKIRDDSQDHLDRLTRWKAYGWGWKSLPDGLKIDDMIEREARAVRGLTKAIEQLSPGF
ncbi:hypothetical protein [uncultured Ruegeria sp.]|uniref:hypothetical protein n=1 Tax=uncultured Ruegeria sp. TaxID=259304 RepID=UPI00262FF6D7|nr:hypothetical protein [uncultured Ruegeria sp.]